MRLKTGIPYQIINADVNQGTPGNPPRLILHDIFEVDGQLICYGTKPVHQQHIYTKGFENIREKGVAFVVLLTEGTNNSMALTKMLGGFHLVIHAMLESDLMYIVNWPERLGSLWWTPMGEDTGKDELLRRARLVIRIYHDWRKNGFVAPNWFLAARSVQRNGGAAPAG